MLWQVLCVHVRAFVDVKFIEHNTGNEQFSGVPYLQDIVHPLLLSSPRTFSSPSKGNHVSTVLVSQGQCNKVAETG